MRNAITTIIAFAAFAATASAHFTLDYPTSRGFDDDLEGQFCGSFTDVVSRTLRGLAVVFANQPFHPFRRAIEPRFP